MKVYELMSQLEDCAAGANVKVSIVLTHDELEKGQDIDEGCYSLILETENVDESRNRVHIGTIAP